MLRSRKRAAPSPSLGQVNYEGMLEFTDRCYQLTVTVTRGTRSWTSQPIPIRSMTEGGASREAAQIIAKLRRALS